MIGLEIDGKVAALTEELVRWRFELYARDQQHHIAFTNPVAGPWKRIIGPAHEGGYEIHRFRRTEVRPDIIVVADHGPNIEVVEAKGVAASFTDAVIKKSFEASLSFARISLACPIDKWLSRRDYPIRTGFLFGSESQARGQESCSALAERLRVASKGLLWAIWVVAPASDELCIYRYDTVSERLRHVEKRSL